MVYPWIEDYLLLALRIDRAFRRLDEMPFVDHFYGPADLRTRVEGEPAPSVDDLARSAIALGDSLASQGFGQERASFLEKQVRSMEGFCRILSGQASLGIDTIQQCLDVRPVRKPETALDQGLALLEQALPGTGDLRGRYFDVLQRTTLPPDQSEQVLPLMERMLAEARGRTQQFVALPDGEEVQLLTVRDKPYGAANWYLGGYRSRLELNVDRPVNLIALLYQMCHEGYPGHHAEFVLKEKHLYRDQGRVEQAAMLVGPQLVISDGIASLAMEMIFGTSELADWIAQAYFERGVPVDDRDLPKLLQALSANTWDDLGGNLVLMQWDGCTDQEIVEYALAYALFTEEQARQMLQYLKSPLKQIYAFTYYQGKRLMEPRLQDDDRLQVFRRLLTGQVYPSGLGEGT